RPESLEVRNAGDSGPVPVAPAVAWHREWACWIAERVKRVWPASIRGRVAPFEAALHEFATSLQTAESGQAVQSALLRLAHQTLPAARVVLVGTSETQVEERNESSPPPENGVSRVDSGPAWVRRCDEVADEVPIRYADEIHGKLLIL